jgi:hypothetical protein
MGGIYPDPDARPGGLLDDTVIRRRLGNAAAFASTGSYPTVAISAALNETWR